MKQIDLKAFSGAIKDYFDLTSFLLPQAEAEETISEGDSFRGTNRLVFIMAIFIASL